MQSNAGMATRRRDGDLRVPQLELWLGLAWLGDWHLPPSAIRQSDSLQITAGQKTLLIERGRITNVIRLSPPIMKDLPLLFCEYC